jgi:ankyrin repeat protein
MLIEHGADTSRTNIFNQTAADLKIIHKFNLQKEFNNLVNMGKYRNNWDKIIYLIKIAPQDCKKEFLSRKIDPNGNTLLHLACLLGQEHYSDQLIKLGAQIDWKNGKGQTCMDLQRIKDAQDRKTFINLKVTSK